MTQVLRTCSGIGTHEQPLFEGCRRHTDATPNHATLRPQLAAEGCRCPRTLAAGLELLCRLTRSRRAPLIHSLQTEEAACGRSCSATTSTCCGGSPIPRAPHLHRPAVQHRQGAGARSRSHRAGRGRRPHGVPGPALPHRHARLLRVRGRLRRLPRLPRAAPARGPAPPDADGSLFFHIDYREVHYCKVLLDGMFGRDPSSTRSSGPTTTARGRGTAGPRSTTPSSGTRATRRTTCTTTTRSTASPTWRPARRPREGRARQDADRHLVAHHRQPDRQGEDRLPDAEAARHPRADREGPLGPRRPGAGLLRGQRHDRRGGSPQRPRLPARRQQPRGGRESWPAGWSSTRRR